MNSTRRVKSRKSSTSTELTARRVSPSATTRLRVSQRLDDSRGLSSSFNAGKAATSRPNIPNLNLSQKAPDSSRVPLSAKGRNKQRDEESKPIAAASHTSFNTESKKQNITPREEGVSNASFGKLKWTTNPSIANQSESKAAGGESNTPALAKALFAPDMLRELSAVKEHLTRLLPHVDSVIHGACHEGHGDAQMIIRLQKELGAAADAQFRETQAREDAESSLREAQRQLHAERLERQQVREPKPGDSALKERLDEVLRELDEEKQRSQHAESELKKTEEKLQSSNSAAPSDEVVKLRCELTESKKHAEDLEAKLQLQMKLEEELNELRLAKTEAQNQAADRQKLQKQIDALQKELAARPNEENESSELSNEGEVILRQQLRVAKAEIESINRDRAAKEADAESVLQQTMDRVGESRNKSAENVCQKLEVRHNYVIRHGERDGDGHNNPITEEGAVQASRAAACLREDLTELERLHKTIIVCSPFLRCLQTAHVISSLTGITDVKVHYGVSEVHSVKVCPLSR
ncbi:hypothetical protein DIPPA_50922 [Diplonema papillatum]|nr:hypothetical protein DIPPA_50922 [Diplonema papillatum]